MQTRFRHCIAALAVAVASFGTLLNPLAISAARADTLELAENAPNRYVVVKGDTLWHISGRFLKKPWRWPEIWQLNKEQIRNPHLIYPGDVVVLDLSGGNPRLRLLRGSDTGNGNAHGDIRLSPSVRMDAAVRPISTVPLGAIEAFMSRPLAIDTEQLDTPARIFATQEDRVYLSKGDRAYARGVDKFIADGVKDFHVYRPARPILDPVTRQTIAYEAEHVGSAKLVRLGDPVTLEIMSAANEVGPGDRLMPATKPELPTWVLRAPDQQVKGFIVGVYGGVRQAGKHMVVTMNLGKRDGIEPGHVLTIWQTGQVIKDKEDKNKPIKLPDERTGELVVFRVFDRIAYGVVMNARTPVDIGDTVVTP